MFSWHSNNEFINHFTNQVKFIYHQNIIYKQIINSENYKKLFDVLRKNYINKKSNRKIIIESGYRKNNIIHNHNDKKLKNLINISGISISQECHINFYGKR